MTSRTDELFLELVLVFQQSAWVGLGKISNPATGKTEANLEAAAHAIDMLAMLRERTRPTLSEPERQLIDNALTQLRLNYVEAASEAVERQKAAKEAAPQASGPPPEEPKDA